MATPSKDHSKPIIFVRNPQLGKMRNPLQSSWNENLTSKNINIDSKINLADLIDFSQMNEVFANYLEVVGLPVAIIDFNGLVLASSNWQRICMEFHRTHSSTLARCLESDTSLSRQMQEGNDYAIYRCCNGLTDCATPIIIEGEHIANLFIGQFFLSQPDLKYFEAQASEFNFDREAYFLALSEAPIVEERKIPAILKMLVGFASQIAKQSLAEHRAKIAYENIEKQVIERTQMLSEALDFNETILLNSPFPMGVYAANGQCILANAAYARMVGATAQELMTQNFHDIQSWKVTNLLEKCLDALHDKSPQRGESHIFSSFGKEIWVDYQITPIKLHKNPHLLIQFADLTERKVLEEELRNYAFHDALTGLPNRRLLLDRLDRAIHHSEQKKSYGAVIFLDLNKFKPLNDVYGHEVGDQLLIEVARRLLALMPGTDTETVVSRIGGDEFVVLLEGLGVDAELACAKTSAIVGQICHTLSAEYVLGSIRHHGSASVGAQLFLGATGSPDQILRQADAAMYEAKKSMSLGVGPSVSFVTK